MALDAAQLRKVLGQFATGITVITTVHEGAPQGMTVNSFTSVSLDPPLILFCADKRARTGVAVGASGTFAVNVLREDQRGLSDLFAGRGTDEERQAELVAIGAPAPATGSPLLPDALAWLDCRVTQAIDAGDHVVYLGEVLDASAGEGGAPLLYYRGTYQGLDETWRWRDRLGARERSTRFHEMVDFFDRMQNEGPYAALLDELVTHASLRGPAGRCLDLGCGTGRVSRELSARCQDVVGVDASAAMLERARERAAELGLGNVTYVEALASALPFPDASFDRVVVANLLHYLADPVATLREVARVLRPSGHVTLLEPSTAMDRAAAVELIKARGLRRFPAYALLTWADAVEAGRRYDEARLGEELGTAGLSVVDLGRRLSGLCLLASAERAA